MSRKEELKSAKHVSGNAAVQIQLSARCHNDEGDGLYVSWSVNENHVYLLNWR